MSVRKKKRSALLAPTAGPLQKKRKAVEGLENAAKPSHSATPSTALKKEKKEAPPVQERVGLEKEDAGGAARNVSASVAEEEQDGQAETTAAEDFLTGYLSPSFQVVAGSIRMQLFPGRPRAPSFVSFSHGAQPFLLYSSKRIVELTHNYTILIFWPVLHIYDFHSTLQTAEPGTVRVITGRFAKRPAVTPLLKILFK